MLIVMQWPLWSRGRLERAPTGRVGVRTTPHLRCAAGVGFGTARGAGRMDETGAEEQRSKLWQKLRTCEQQTEHTIGQNITIQYTT